MSAKKYDDNGAICIGYNGENCEYKPWSEFNKSKSRPSGYDNLCRACRKKQRQSKTYKANNRKRMAEKYSTVEGKQTQQARPRTK